MIAYKQYIFMVGADPSYLEPDKATKFFKKMGLEIKEGTWTWERVLEDGEDGDLWTSQKFLGVLYKYSRGPETTELVPYLEYEDWLKNLLVTRVSPDAKRADVEKEGRRRFDALRGTFVTGAFSNERMVSLLDSMLQKVPAEHVLMAVQAGNGKGDTPDNDLLLGKDFEYPDSFSWPTVRWCQNLYFSEGNRWPDAEWAPVFPELVEDVKEIRANRKSFMINSLGAAGIKTPFGNAATVVALPEEDEPDLAPKDVPMEGTYNRVGVRTGPIQVRDPEGNDCGKLKTNIEIIRTALAPSVHPLVYPRARDFELINEGRFDEVSVNGQVFIELVAHPEYGLKGNESPEDWGQRVCKDTNFRIHPVVPVSTLVSKTGLKEERLVKYATEYGLIVVGKPPAAYISAVRVDIPGFAPQPPPKADVISKATPNAIIAKKFEKDFGVPVAHDVFESPIVDPRLNDTVTKAVRGTLPALQELLAFNKVVLAMDKEEDLYSFYIQNNVSQGPEKAYKIERRFIGSIRANAPRVARTKAAQAIFAFLDAPQEDLSPVKPPATWGEEDEVDTDLAVREYIWRDRVLFRQEGSGPLKIVDNKFVKGWKETEEGNLQRIGYDLVLPRKQPQVVFKLISKLYKNLECTIQHAPTSQPLSQISKKAAEKWRKERSQSRSSYGSDSGHGSAGSGKPSSAPSKKDSDARRRDSSYRSGSSRTDNGGIIGSKPKNRGGSDASGNKSPGLHRVASGESGKALCAVETCKNVVGIRPGLCSDCTRRFGLAPLAGHGAKTTEGRRRR
nr:MAG: RNA-dependent RNA polymerase [Riboviria sp.]